MFTITLDEAKAIYAQPKQRGRRAAVPPLAEFGADPTTEKPVVVKDGRFGPYVTDGETNATVPRSVSLEQLTKEHAFSLLAEKRASGPAPKKSGSGAARKPAAKKSTAKKSTAKSSTAKKSAASKSSASTTTKKRSGAGTS